MTTLTDVSLENVAHSLEIAWEVARESKGHQSWIRHWDEISIELGAYHGFLNWNSTLEEKERGGVNELLDDLLWLREVVWEIRDSYRD